MIDQSDIEARDFSISMAEVIAKVRSIASLCKHNDEEVMTVDLLNGLGCFLWEISDDLNDIYLALYPKESLKELRA